MIRLVFCISTLDVGGAERQLVQLICGLSRSRYEPTLLVLGTPPRPPQDELLSILGEQRVSVQFLNARGWRDGPRVLSQLRQAFATLRPDIVQAFLAHANVAVALAARRTRSPAIVTGIRVADERINLHAALSRWTEARVARHVCVSESVRMHAVERMGLDRGKTLVVPNGVDVARMQGVERLPVEELGLPAGRRLLLSVSRLDRQKRVDWMLARLPRVFARLAEHHLVIAGEGPERRRLERQIRRLGLASRVHLVGWRDDLPRLYAAAEIVLLSSAWEGMPGAILEAMAAGRPVVTTRVQGVEELLGDNAPAQVVAADDTAGFEAMLMHLATDGARREALGSANRARAIRHFSIDAMVTRYEALYTDLVQSAGVAP